MWRQGRSVVYMIWCQWMHVGAYLGASRSRWPTKQLADSESIGPESNPPARFRPCFSNLLIKCQHPSDGMFPGAGTSQSAAPLSGSLSCQNPKCSADSPPKPPASSLQCGRCALQLPHSEFDHLVYHRHLGSHAGCLPAAPGVFDHVRSSSLFSTQVWSKLQRASLFLARDCGGCDPTPPSCLEYHGIAACA
jgi:hypothetical protein